MIEQLYYKKNINLIFMWNGKSERKRKVTFSPEPFMMLSETINTLFKILGSSFSRRRIRRTRKLEPPKSSDNISSDSFPVGKWVTYVGIILTSASLFLVRLRPLSISDSRISIIWVSISSLSLSSSSLF